MSKKFFCIFCNEDHEIIHSENKIIILCMSNRIFSISYLFDKEYRFMACDIESSFGNKIRISRIENNNIFDMKYERKSFGSIELLEKIDNKNYIDFIGFTLNYMQNCIKNECLK